MADPCMDVVRLWDRDRYLSTLLAPVEKQPYLFALYAFDADVARISSLVSEPQIGEIRLQWWLDTLETVFSGDKVDHPVASALAAAVAQCRLSKAALTNLVEARSRELYADPMPDLNELEGYLGETKSAVMVMACQILLGGPASGVEEAAGFGGVAQGIAHIFAHSDRLPHDARNLLPVNVDATTLIEHGLKRLDEATLAIDQVPPLARPAFLPLATTRTRLHIVKTKGPGHDMSHLRAQWLIWKASWR